MYKKVCNSRSCIVQWNTKSLKININFGLTYHKIFINGLNENFSCKMTSNFSDIYILGKRCSPGKIFILDQFYESLRGFVDHGIGDNTSLSKSCPKS